MLPKPCSSHVVGPTDAAGSPNSGLPRQPMPIWSWITLPSGRGLGWDCPPHLVCLTAFLISAH